MEETGIMAAILAYLPLVAQIIGTFAVVATLTPNKVDNRIAQILMDLVNFIGGNLGKAKNVE
jgi:hypothetical protein